MIYAHEKTADKNGICVDLILTLLLQTSDLERSDQYCHYKSDN